MSNDKELEVGGVMTYHGWLIVREEEDFYLVFTPENADYPSRRKGKETGTLADAKDWIDNYDTEENK